MHPAASSSQQQQQPSPAVTSQTAALVTTVARRQTSTVASVVEYHHHNPALIIHLHSSFLIPAPILYLPAHVSVCPSYYAPPSGGGRLKQCCIRPSFRQSHQLVAATAGAYRLAVRYLVFVIVTRQYPAAFRFCSSVYRLSLITNQSYM